MLKVKNKIVCWKDIYSYYEPNLNTGFVQDLAVTIILDFVWQFENKLIEVISGLSKKFHCP